MTICTSIIPMDDKEAEIMSNESSKSDNETDDDNGDINENAGWADSISKILKSKKPKGKKTLILSKGKKLSDVVVKKPAKVEFEIETVTGEVKQEVDVKEEESQDIETNKQFERRKKKDLPILRKKPNILKKDRERALCKIATKGVVQLFNAIRTQQVDTSKKLEEAGSMEIKRNKVLKNVDKKAFLNMLMSKQSEPVFTKETVSNKSSTKTEKSWSVLRDDFMIGAKLKDWDKDIENEEEMEHE